MRRSVIGVPFSLGRTIAICCRSTGEFTRPSAACGCRGRAIGWHPAPTRGTSRVVRGYAASRPTGRRFDGGEPLRDWAKPPSWCAPPRISSSRRRPVGSYEALLRMTAGRPQGPSVRDPKTFHLDGETVARDAEQPRGLGPVAAGAEGRARPRLPVPLEYDRAVGGAGGGTH